MTTYITIKVCPDQQFTRTASLNRGNFSTTSHSGLHHHQRLSRLVLRSPSGRPACGGCDAPFRRPKTCVTEERRNATAWPIIASPGILAPSPRLSDWVKNPKPWPFRPWPPQWSLCWPLILHASYSTELSRQEPLAKRCDPVSQALDVDGVGLAYPPAPIKHRVMFWQVLISSLRRVMKPRCRARWNGRHNK